ncbi:MAG: hypothetical protein ACOCRK_11575 [bacterium]
MKELDAIIGFHDLEKYKSREYCRDRDCYYQKIIDNEENTEQMKEDTKRYCSQYCRAYDFHQWLENNGYKIIKKE